jgi:drug/metabolite transporter (DMT)-like permease
LPPPEAFTWAALAGAAGVTGLGFFYLALARGAMGLVAPLGALIGAALPSVVAIGFGEQVGELRLLGIVVALLAVVLISLPAGGETSGARRAARIDLRELPLVIVAGLGFAAFYLFLDRAASAGAQTLWPLIVVRLVGLLAVGVVIGVLLARQSGPSIRSRLAAIVGLPRLRHVSIGLLGIVTLFAFAGAGDLGGNVFFLLANEADVLPVAVVLSSLYPVVTAMLAAGLLGERLRAWQLAGIALAVLGVALIALGASGTG